MRNILRSASYASLRGASICRFPAASSPRYVARRDFSPQNTNPAKVRRIRDTPRGVTHPSEHWRDGNHAFFKRGRISRQSSRHHGQPLAELIRSPRSASARYYRARNCEGGLTVINVGASTATALAANVAKNIYADMKYIATRNAGYAKILSECGELQKRQ